MVLPESAREPRRSREVLLENATPHEHGVAWCARPYLPMAPENDRPGRFPNGTGRTTLARLPPPRKETATTALTAAAGATPMAQPRPLPDECLCGLRGLGPAAAFATKEPYDGPIADECLATPAPVAAGYCLRAERSSAPWQVFGGSRERVMRSRMVVL